MIQEACHCNFGIPGVDRLPSHDHNAERMAVDMQRMNPDNPKVAEVVAGMTLRDSVRIWVDWKAIARPSTQSQE